MAIHCEPESEERRLKGGERNISSDRSLTPFLVIEILPTFVIARAKPVAIHCEPLSEQTNPSAFPETRWIAASLAPLFPRNDKRVLSLTGTLYCFHHFVIARAKPWRSTMRQNQPVMHERVHLSGWSSTRICVVSGSTYLSVLN